MKSIKCPYCGGKFAQANKPGKVACSFCGKEFYVGYDKLKQAWISIDPDSPIQAIFIQGKKEKK